MVSLGTIEPRKNHLRLLRAWQSLPSPRPRLVLIGRRGWQCEEIVEAMTANAQKRPGEFVDLPPKRTRATDQI